MTPTGRFRRDDGPNMQNIPVRTETGNAIRDAFTGVIGAAPRSAVSERAKVVAYLHGLADGALRDAATMGPEDDRSEPRERDATAYRSAAQAIENGEHWQS